MLLSLVKSPIVRSVTVELWGIDASILLLVAASIAAFWV
jgi:hypothetical protein